MRTVCPGLCVLRFKYLATPTRHTTEAAVGTGLPNHCLQPAYPVFTLSVLCVCLSFHHDDYAIALLCLYPSTYSAASCS